MLRKHFSKHYIGSRGQKERYEGQKGEEMAKGWKTGKK
jgi:hypothetical protein